jgi:hypothetical protein
MLTNPELRRIVVNHVHDLVALARDAAEVANGRGLRAARLHAIKADIRASLGEQGLSLTTTAARHGRHAALRADAVRERRDNILSFLLGERLARAAALRRNTFGCARSCGAGELVGRAHRSQPTQRRWDARA